MASLDNLPADESAVLQLVLQRGRSYDEIARLLSIDRAAVRTRALAALNALGPHTRVPPERRALITDYLLGQLPPRVADETRARLAESPSERAWARVVASELAPMASSPLPEIPTTPEPDELASPESPQPTAAASPAQPEPPSSLPPAAPPPGEGEPQAPRQRRISRFGGMVLIAGAVIVVLIVVIAVIASGGSSSSTTSTSRTDSTSTSTAAASASTPTVTTTSTAAKVVAQINLLPPTAGTKTAGIAEVLKEGATDGIAIVAQNVPPNTTHPPNAYAVWLYNSPTDAVRLGFVNPAVGNTGKLSTAGALPANTAHYKELIITVETTSDPKTPGKIILQGAVTGLS
jgi:hypothetical protein